jgi:hypothetical protein
MATVAVKVANCPKTVGVVEDNVVLVAAGLMMMAWLDPVVLPLKLSLLGTYVAVIG